ncbi:hypothetical protein DL98DRAFT_439890 [Cadophora sp. DSE1049]|nr:hypothetical protein DL98DRAFT_439890 [Cadophora sp. DSE1049]
MQTVEDYSISSRESTKHKDASYTDSDRGFAKSNISGETSGRHSELGRNMRLDFEIYVVKVPLLSLHGIQFKRISGGTWQYKNMAVQILREVRL